MATLQDILSPQARIDGLAQTPLPDPLGGTSGVSALPATILQSSGTALPASVMDASGASAFSGPGPIGLQPHPVPSLATRVPTPGRGLYGPSRILGETYSGGTVSTPRAPADPNAGLASRIAQAATSPEAAPSGFLATPTGRGIRAVLYGLGQTLPATSRGLTGVLGSAARGFTATVDDLQAQRAQQAEAQQAAQQRAFQSQLGQAQLGLTQAQTNAYQKLADQRESAANDPGTPTIRQGWDGRWYRLSDDGKSMIPLAGIPANPNAGNGAQTPPQKLYTSLTQKYLTMTDPATGQRYAPDEAAGLAAQATMGRFPSFTVEGYQPAKQPVTDADIAQLTARFRAAGMNPAQIAQAVEQRRSAGRPHVVGFTPTPQGGGAGAKMSAADRWDALTAGGMSADSATAQVHREIAAGTVTP